MYKNITIKSKLIEVLKKEPILILAEPIGKIISSHLSALLKIKGLTIGNIISLTRDCIKFNAAIPIINATEIAIILYSLRKPTNLLNRTIR